MRPLSGEPDKVAPASDRRDAGETRTRIAFEAQKRVLAMLARGEPVDDLLAELCRGVEALEPGAIASILVLDRDTRTFHHGIAPSIAPTYCAAVAGAPVGPPHVGTCGAGVFGGEPVASLDVVNDDRWHPAWRQLCADHNLRACQSTPILATDGRALGSLMLSFSEPGDLGTWDPQTIALSVQLASLVLERLRAVEDLKELNQKLEERVEERTRERDRLWDLSEDLLVAADYEGRLLRISPSWSRLLGHDQATLLGQPYRDIIHPDDLDAVIDGLRQMRRTGRPVRLEDRLRATDGSWRWVAWTLSPDPGGELIHGVGRDITADKQAAEALSRAEEQLRQSQKMEALGLLTGGIAHDFNNLLAAVLGNLELVELRLGDERLRKMVQAASRAAERGAKLTEQLLGFSRKQHLVADAIDLNAAILGMTEMLRRTLGGTTEVQTALADALWPALVDRTQLEVGLLNLAINARDAMGVGGVVLIETRNVSATGRDKPPTMAPGDYVAIAVSDTGFGMSEEVIVKAIEPFFTTKETGKGTGLGLSQVYGLAKQSGGDLRIKSALGRGTTVEVFLPRALHDVSADAPAPQIAAAECPGARASVLVVDDQADVREVAVAYLEALGHSTVQASSGRLAIDLLNRVPAPEIDLLLVDYAMPGVSGSEVARAARAKRPGLPVVVVTGYAETSMLDEPIEGALFLRKPYRLQELAATIEAALARRAGASTNVVPIRSGRA